MLSYFRIQNYRSILDMKIDFSYAEKRAPNKYGDLTKIPFLEINDENRFVPALAIYGANASGKTNIIRAFKTYKDLIRNQEINGLYDPNKLNKKYEATIFEVEFFVDKNKYKHSIEYDNTEIKREILYKNNKVIYEIDNTKYYNNFENIKAPAYDKKKIINILKVECCEQKNDSYIQRKVFLSVIGKGYSGLNTDIFTTFNTIRNILSAGSNKFVKTAIDGCNDEENRLLLEKITALIQKFDIDILKIMPTLQRFQTSILPESFVKQLETNKEMQKRYNYNLQEKLISMNTINVYHRNNEGQEVIFDFDDESDGTKIIFGLLYIIVKALDTGRTLIIDEIDRSIHPLVLSEIIKLFKDKDYNKNNAQLIFTTHCTDILEMDILRISEVATVTKTLNTGSTISRISDFKYTEEFKNIRNTTDFRKLYLQGVFGGIPFPYI